MLTFNMDLGFLTKEYILSNDTDKIIYLNGMFIPVDKNHNSVDTLISCYRFNEFKNRTRSNNKEFKLSDEQIQNSFRYNFGSDLKYKHDIFLYNKNFNFIDYLERGKVLTLYSSDKSNNIETLKDIDIKSVYISRGIIRENIQLYALYLGRFFGEKYYMIANKIDDIEMFNVSNHIMTNYETKHKDSGEDFSKYLNLDNYEYQIISEKDFLNTYSQFNFIFKENKTGLDGELTNIRNFIFDNINENSIYIKEVQNIVDKYIFPNVNEIKSWEYVSNKVGFIRSNMIDFEELIVCVSGKKEIPINHDDMLENHIYRFQNKAIMKYKENIYVLKTIINKTSTFSLLDLDVYVDKNIIPCKKEFYNSQLHKHIVEESIAIIEERGVTFYDDYFVKL